MSSTDREDDPSFQTLSARLRHRIDSAFDTIATKSPQSRPEVLAGGFIVEESEPGPSRSEEYEAGGFIVESHASNHSGARSRIFLSDIPRALNLLDLSPDDDIMGVFRNAATGWGAQSARDDAVSRKDWRAVCAALLEGEHVEGSDNESPVVDEDFEMAIDGGSDSDEYQTEEVEGTSNDEYEEASRTAVRTSKVSQREPAKSWGADISRQLTDPQKAQCRQDFARFFPHVLDDELDHQRIMIKDVHRVADLLKENLRTEEILEMLEAFSTSPDKSMNLTDFEHMMILTKLV